jgi:DNA-binding transcriptional LysR family regulator
MADSGVGWISELCVIEELRSGRLVELKTAALALERPLYTLKLRGRHFSRSVLAFLEDFD